MDGPQHGISRRLFLKGFGASALAAGALPALGRAAQDAPAREARPDGVVGPDPVEITLTVNGEARTLTVEPRVTLVDALRDRIGLTGPKKVCDRATCGACTVLLDGAPVYACTVLAIAAEGRAIETVESLAKGDALASIQAAFVANDAQQCGFCTPGFVTACAAFVRDNPGCSAADAAAGLGGNLCRCGTYVGVRQAVADAAKGGE